jgi:hypothetical protein
MDSHYRIHFQKGQSLPAFLKSYGTEQQCREALLALRWPDGFVCPRCVCRTGHALHGRPVTQCAKCRKQTSLTAGTIFHCTKLPLVKWFLAIHLISQTKTGMSGLELSRHLGVQQRTAWLIQQKVMDAATEAEAGRQLRERAEVDDAYMGGRCPGKTVGRGSPNKVPFLIGLDKNQRGRPRYLTLSVLANFKKATIADWAKRHLAPGTCVQTDGLAGFGGVEAANAWHLPVSVLGDKHILNTKFLWTSTILGNVKMAMAGILHHAGDRYLHRYFGLIQYRFNRRWNLTFLFRSMLRLMARSSERPMAMIRLAESHA